MPEKAPNAANLYEAAMNHLARYAATESSLSQVLARRIDRWGQKQAETIEPDDIAHSVRQAKASIPGVLARLKELGVLNDTAFAASRAKRLVKSGKSRQATLAHLAAKGIRNPVLSDDPERELAAACAFLRRRRAGPYGDAAPEKILAAMGRGGFSQAIARRALALSREEADKNIAALDERAESMLAGH